MKAGWEAKLLGDVLEVQNGYAFDSKNFNPSNGKPLIRIRSLKEGIETETFFDGIYDDKYLVNACDLLIGMDGEFGCYEWKGPASLLNQRVCRLQGFDAKLLPKFLFYGVNSYLKAIEDVTGFTTVKHLSSKQILNIKVPLPPLPEQHRIVAILDAAFDHIATARANCEANLLNARAIFESHLQAVFTQRGDGWERTTLGKATGGIFTGPFGSLLHKSDYVPNGIPLVNPAHITEVGIEPDFLKTVSKETATRLKSYIMRTGDIVIGRRGEMGRCALVTEVEDGWVCGTGSFYIKPSSRCETRYLVRFLRSDGCKARLESIAGGTVMPNLSNTALSNLPIDLPSPEKQAAIVDGIDELHVETLRLASLYQRKLQTLDDLKKSLLHQAFSGLL